MSERSDAIIEIKTADIASRITERENIYPTEALRRFMSTKTYELLQNPETYLCFEGVEYIWDMLNAELCGDWERWLEA
ncbi:MAG: hypothetical protein LBG12_15005 [Synergistaceae bacterium]|nr:hypothetical protein [Synergistaceae bacterium]